MSNQSRYTICMDDNSKLSGYSEQSFVGTNIAKEGDLLMLFLEPGNYINFNWSRVRWYRRDGIATASSGDEGVTL